MRSLYRSLLLAAAVLVFGTVPAQAQEFPSKLTSVKENVLQAAREKEDKSLTKEGPLCWE